MVSYGTVDGDRSFEDARRCPIPELQVSVIGESTRTEYFGKSAPVPKILVTQHPHSLRSLRRSSFL